MNKKKKVLIFSLVIFVMAGFLCMLAGCKRSSTSTKIVQLSPAEYAAQKISGYSNPDAVISVYELNDMLNDPNLVILDARGGTSRTLKAALAEGYLPGAIQIIASHYQDPARWNSVAPAKYIERYLRELGLDNYSKIVIYGNDNCLQGRVYWMLKMYGCDNEVKILDGGFEKWKETDLQENIEKLTRLPRGNFGFNPVKEDLSFKTDLKEMGAVSSSNDPNNIIIDARLNNDYVSGHIPSSVNVSINDILNDDKTFKTAQELADIFTSRGVTQDKNVYVYSTDGSESCLVWYVLHELMGYPSVKNYYGGFKEWKYRERPFEKGDRSALNQPASK